MNHKHWFGIVAGAAVGIAAAWWLRSLGGSEDLTVTQTPGGGLTVK